MQARPVVERRQSQRRHRRTEVGAADADVDHVGELAALPGDGAGAHAVGEGRHAVEHLVDHRHDVLALRAVDRVGGGAQRHMQDRPILGDVDRLAGEHGVAALLDASRIRQRQQAGHHLVVDEVLGIVEQEIVEAGREPREAAGIVGETLAQRRGEDGGPVRFQRGEGPDHGGVHACDLS